MIFKFLNLTLKFLCTFFLLFSAILLILGRYAANLKIAQNTAFTTTAFLTILVYLIIILVDHY